MHGISLKITYIGGPTAVLELDGLRFVTDPTFDPAQEYKLSAYNLRKLTGPALTPEAVGAVNAVLLSHDHHMDNLDQEGRKFLARAERVLTTTAGAERLQKNAVGLAPWQTTTVSAKNETVLRVTATPAQHGPADHERGPVSGFIVAREDAWREAIYVSGDTVWFAGIEEVARRFEIKTAVLFMGAARVPEVGPYHLTLTAEEGIKAARAMPGAAIVPVHYEGWAHFSESRQEIERAFAGAGIAQRLRWPEPGRLTVIEEGSA